MLCPVDLIDDPLSEVGTRGCALISSEENGPFFWPLPVSLSGSNNLRNGGTLKKMRMNYRQKVLRVFPFVYFVKAF